MSESTQELSQPESDELTRILLIDDSKVMRKSALKMLGAEFDVVVAEEGESGWAMIQQDPTIEVVFTDLNMPKMNGYELLSSIRQADNEAISNLPVVVVTGAENDNEAKEKALQLGATDFITKPFNSTDLKARARSYANYRRTTKDLQQAAVMDPVTGLGNERLFFEHLERDLSFISRHKVPIAVLLVEVDQFNALFLKIGRKAADSLIQQVAKVLLKNVRKEDALGRMGLARFAVSLPASDVQGAQVLAQRIVKTISGFKAKLRGETLPISVSIGLCVPSPDEVSSVKGLITETESCLKKALELGGNQVFAQSTRPETASEGSSKLISVDEVLKLLNAEGIVAVEPLIPDVLEQLAPLLAVLSPEQKQQLGRQLEDES